MKANLEIDPNFRREITRRDPLAKEWLEYLPETLEQLMTRGWIRSIDGPPAFGKTSLVIPVMSSSGPAALKLVSPAGDIEAEERALKLFADGPIVRLFDASIPERALLLERLDGATSIREMSPESSVTIAGEIAAILANVVAPDAIPSLASDALGWVYGIGEQHRLAETFGRQVPDAQIKAVEAAIRALSHDQTNTITHGDLSLENILLSSARGWLAIDPLLVRGPVINEAHTVIRSLLPQILESEHPETLLRNFTRRFCDAAGADYESAQRLSLARYVASYYWEAQNKGDPANIERLRRASQLTFDILY